MACYRCGERQLEPGRGSDPWQQGVIGERQVLICPGCQSAGDWAADLDHCAVCASIQLVRRLGEVECRGCGATGEAAAPQGSSASAALADVRPAGLSDEVEQALARVLRRAPAGEPGSSRLSSRSGVGAAGRARAADQKGPAATWVGSIGER